MGKKQRTVRCPDCGHRNPKKLTPREKRVNLLFNGLCLSLQKRAAEAGNPMSFRQIQDAMSPLILDLLNSDWQDADNLPYPIWYDEVEGRLKWTLNENEGKPV